MHKSIVMEIIAGLIVATYIRVLFERFLDYLGL